MRRIFYDTEFIDDGKTIELISIGMVDEEGKELYFVNGDCSFERVLKSKWLRENVLPYLPAKDDDWDRTNLNGYVVLPKSIIAKEVRNFILQPGISSGLVPDHNKFELWAYFAAYDHVALAQLFGPMMYLPSGIPMFTHDIKQEMDRMDITKKEMYDNGVRENVNAHNALDDARWNLDAWKYLTSKIGGPIA